LAVGEGGVLILFILIVVLLVRWPIWIIRRRAIHERLDKTEQAIRELRQTVERGFATTTAIEKRVGALVREIEAAVKSAPTGAAVRAEVPKSSEPAIKTVVAPLASAQPSLGLAPREAAPAPSKVVEPIAPALPSAEPMPLVAESGPPKISEAAPVEAPTPDQGREIAEIAPRTPQPAPAEEISTWELPPETFRPPPRPRRTPLRDAVRAALAGTDLAGADWETIIGRRWLSLVGVVVLVIGIVLLIQQALIHLGPLGKIATGVGVAAALLAAGGALGRKPIYLAFARTLLGGGWALLYFVAYASHNIPAAKVVDNPFVAFALLFGVATGMILHSLLYRSQLLTALAYGLGFLAITMSPPTAFSLVASAVLSASLIAIVRAFPWHMLVSLGVASTYLTHWRWLEANELAWRARGAEQEALRGYFLSAGVLALYWALYVLASFARRPETKSDRIAHYATSLFNAAGLLGMVAWQMNAFERPDLHILTALACPAFAIVALADRRLADRLTFLFNASVAVALFAATLPLMVRESGASANWLTLWWGAGGAVVLALGARWREPTLRIEGYGLLAFSAASAWLVNLDHNLWPVSSRQWLAAPLVILLFQGIGEALARDRASGWRLPIEERAPHALAVAAAALLGRLLWTLVEPGEAGLSWLIAAFVYWETGLAAKREPLRLQGALLLIAGAIAVFGINLGGALPVAASGAKLAIPGVWIEALSVAALYGAEARLMMNRTRVSRMEAALIGAPSAAATLMLALTVAKEAPNEYVAAAWMLAALILFEAGLRTRELRIAAEGYALAAVAAIAAIWVNIYELAPVAKATPIVRDFLAPAFVALGLAAIYLMRERVRGATGRLKWNETATQNAVAGVDALSYAAALLAALILWKELPSIAVAVAWTLASLIVFETAAIANLRAQRNQAHLLILAAFIRLFLANFATPAEVASFAFLGATWTVSQRLVSVVPVIASLYYLRARLIAAQREEEAARGWRAAVPALYSYLAAALAFALMRFEFGRDFAAVGWSAAALILLRIGVSRGDRNFRIQAYLLAALSFARCWSSSVYLVGGFYGLPERVATVVPVIVALFALALMSPREQPTAPGALDQALSPPRWASLLDRYGRPVMATLASALVAIFLFYQSSTEYVSIGWAISALALIAFGFATRDRAYRWSGLFLLLITLLKVTLLDLAGVETIYRIASFIVLGVILLLASFAYSRYRGALKKFL
jgi:hypothetical protein